ncbi:hypothetical protein BH20ACI2_BH20ACI2_20850 [soil metagenome]
MSQTQKAKTTPHRDLVARPFDFESYGVKIRINGNDQDLIDDAAEVARRSLLGDVRGINNEDFDHYFELMRSSGGGSFLIEQNGEYVARGRSRRKFLKFFDSVIRVAVGEYAVDRVFLHAGVVGWKGKAIVLPADSFQGKSTLVAELVRKGATYFSDEFAVLDVDGLVYPFARKVSLRTENYKTYELSIDDLGGTTGTLPVPVGMVLLTGYRSGVKWRPKILSPGAGVMKIMPFALSLNSRPEFSLKVLHNVATRAIIASGSRGSAEIFARTLLNFVDKHVD